MCVVLFIGVVELAPHQIASSAVSDEEISSDEVQPIITMTEFERLENLLNKMGALGYIDIKNKGVDDDDDSSEEVDDYNSDYNDDDSDESDK